MQIPRCSPFFISKDGGKQKSMLAGSSGQDHTVLYCVLGGAAAAALILGFADGSDFFCLSFLIHQELYPAWFLQTKSELENGPVEIVDLAIFIAWWIFPVRFLLTFTRQGKPPFSYSFPMVFLWVFLCFLLTLTRPGGPVW